MGARAATSTLDGVLVTDPAFAGSDTLATARALAAALEREGPFDLVLVGRNSVDADTGQVGPELAELLDLPFVTGVRHLTRSRPPRCTCGASTTTAGCRREVELPAVLSTAERLIDPCKVDPDGPRRGRAPSASARVHRRRPRCRARGARRRSPTAVGAVRVHRRRRARVPCSTGPSTSRCAPRSSCSPGGARSTEPDDDADRRRRVPARAARRRVGRSAVVVEPDRAHVTRELLGAAARAGRRDRRPRRRAHARDRRTRRARVVGRRRRRSRSPARSSRRTSPAASPTWATRTQTVGDPRAEHRVGSRGRRARGRARSAPGSPATRSTSRSATAGSSRGSRRSAASSSPRSRRRHRSRWRPSAPGCSRRSRRAVDAPRARVARPSSARGRVQRARPRPATTTSTCSPRPPSSSASAGASRPTSTRRSSRCSTLLGAELGATRKVTDRGLAAACPPDRHHRPHDRAAPLRRARRQREVQPHGRRARGRTPSSRSTPTATRSCSTRADIGIVADVREVVPLLVAEIEQVQGRTCEHECARGRSPTSSRRGTSRCRRSGRRTPAARCPRPRT